MFKNPFKTSFRNLVAFINIPGLKTGITCSLILLLYAVDKLTHDRHYSNAENTCRVMLHVREADGEYTRPLKQEPVAKALVGSQERYKSADITQDVMRNAPFSFEVLISVNSLPTFRLQTNWGRVMLKFEWKVPTLIWSPARYAALFAVIGLIVFQVGKKQ